MAKYTDGTNTVDAVQLKQDQNVVGYNAHGAKDNTAAPTVQQKTVAEVAGTKTTASSGDYIITKADGSKQLVTKATFEATYSLKK